MEFRVLGPVEAYTGGNMLPPGAPQQRLVLAALTVEAGRVVTAETLIDRVWDEAPDSARRNIHVQVTRIRRLLEQADRGTPDGVPARLVRRSGGYLLDIDPDRVDVHRFRRLVRQARDPGCPDLEAVSRLREAVGLWRGEALTGLAGQWAAGVRDAWRQEYLDATVVWAAAELCVGNPAAVIPPLTGLVSQYPLAEPLVVVLMHALHAAGYTAAALDRYTETRRRLADELGIGPGTGLQAVHRAILRGSPDPPYCPRPGPGHQRREWRRHSLADLPGSAGRGDLTLVPH